MREDLGAHCAPGLLIYRSNKGDDKDRGDQHQRTGGDEAQRDEKDGAGLCRIPGLGGPHEGEKRGEEGKQDQDHTPRKVPNLDRRPLHRVGDAPAGRVAGLAHALDSAPELPLAGEPYDAREVVSLGGGLAHPQQLQVVASVQLDGAGVRRGELLQEGVGVETGGVAAGLAPCRVTRAAAGDLRHLQKEHLAGELYRALALAAPRGYLRSYPARAVLLAPQVVDLLLVEIPILQRVGRIAQAVGLLERLGYPAFIHGLVLTPYSTSHAPKNPFRVLNDTMSVLVQKPIAPRRFRVSRPPNRSPTARRIDPRRAP